MFQLFSGQEMDWQIKCVYSNILGIVVILANRLTSDKKMENTRKWHIV